MAKLRRLVIGSASCPDVVLQDIAHLRRVQVYIPTRFAELDARKARSIIRWLGRWLEEQNHG